MAYQIKNFVDNANVKVINEKGPFKVVEYQKDLSVSPNYASMAYFSQEMNVRKRQVVCDVSKGNIVTQKGAMQWTIGKVDATTGLKGVGDFMKKAMRSTVTNESTIKPEYKGNGLLVLEPSYKHILLVNPNEMFNGQMVIDDGLFLACEGTLTHSVIARTNLSSALAGGEGLFNLALSGNGIVALESVVPIEELIQIYLDNDEIRIDGPYALAWSSSLDFRVERSGKTLLGSAASGEGLVNVYRGTGTVLMSPISNNVKFGAGSMSSF